MGEIGFDEIRSNSLIVLSFVIPGLVPGIQTRRRRGLFLNGGVSGWPGLSHGGPVRVSIGEKRRELNHLGADFPRPPRLDFVRKAPLSIWFSPLPAGSAGLGCEFAGALRRAKKD
jgi:hypothetical protein